MARVLQERPLPTPDRLATQPLRTVPAIPAMPSPTASPGTIDIAAMARQGATLTSPPPVLDSSHTLRVFITLDMPRGSLQRLVEQAERSGATLVLRGLKAQSMRQTLTAASELIGSRRVSWVIDPNAFDRFRVRVAPTFVLMLSGDPAPDTPGLAPAPELPRCSGITCTTPTDPSQYLAISGDVSLDYALDAMQRRSADAVPLARAILQRLRPP
jgi:conjugal transfer pilus assembly protein TrbC